MRTVEVKSWMATWGVQGANHKWGETWRPLLWRYFTVYVWWLKRIKASGPVLDINGDGGNAGHKCLDR